MEQIKNIYANILFHINHSLLITKTQKVNSQRLAATCQQAHRYFVLKNHRIGGLHHQLSVNMFTDPLTRIFTLSGVVVALTVARRQLPPASLYHIARSRHSEECKVQ